MKTRNPTYVQECHTLYADPEHGLISIAETLGLKLLAPRKKITIMLIGNHSAGKSSFINWYVISQSYDVVDCKWRNCVVLLGYICRYIEEHVQRTGVAIETQGFSFVTSGRFATAS